MAGEVKNRVILHKISKDGEPSKESLEYGEIAINYAKGMESIYIKNDNDEVVSFNAGDNKMDKPKEEGSVGQVLTKTEDGVEYSKAFEIMPNGDVYVMGLGGYDGTNAGAEGVQTIQQVINSIPRLVGNYIQSITQEGGYIKYVSNNFRTNNADTKFIDFKTINGNVIFGQGDLKL